MNGLSPEVLGLTCEYPFRRHVYGSNDGFRTYVLMQDDESAEARSQNESGPFQSTECSIVRLAVTVSMPPIAVNAMLGTAAGSVPHHASVQVVASYE